MSIHSSISDASNPFVGPDPTDIRDINIHDRGPVILDATNSTYYTWKTYFSLLFGENNLVDHVDGTVDSRAMVDDSEWTAIDATLTQWFFTTISKDLFHKVDDQSIDDYCRCLKTLSDELRDIGAKIDDDILLSTLTAGLNKDFGNATANLTLTPEPSFPKFMAYLRLEEHQMKHVKKRVQHHAIAAGTSGGTPPPPALLMPRQLPPPRPRGTTPSRLRPPSLPLHPSISRKAAGGAATATGAGAPSSSRHTGGGGASQQHPTPPWTYGTNPWTSVVQAYSMPVPRPPTPAILGSRPASHQAYLAVPDAAPYPPFLHHRSRLAMEPLQRPLMACSTHPRCRRRGSRTPRRLALGSVTQ
nr:uncharacterized protein LOC120969124 [Aegilops tauschii subsp. strangulata]